MEYKSRGGAITLGKKIINKMGNIFFILGYEINHTIYCSLISIINKNSITCLLFEPKYVLEGNTEKY